MDHMLWLLGAVLAVGAVVWWLGQIKPQQPKADQEPLEEEKVAASDVSGDDDSGSAG